MAMVAPGSGSGSGCLTGQPISFFQVLDDDYAQGMCLPLGVSNWYRTFLPENSEQHIKIYTPVCTKIVVLNVKGNGLLRFHGKGWMDIVDECCLKKDCLVICEFFNSHTIRLLGFGNDGLLHYSQPHRVDEDDGNRCVARRIVKDDLSESMKLPLDALNYLERNTNGHVLLETIRGEWTVEYAGFGHNEVFLIGAGWRKFVEDNGLQKGYVLLMLHMYAHTYRVVIYNNTQIRHVCRHEPPIQEFSSTPAVVYEHIGDYDVPAEAPVFFEQPLAEHVIRRRDMTIPAAFVVANNLMTKKTANLATYKGVYAVDLVVMRDSRSPRTAGRHVVMRQDWRDFKDDNELEVGRMCRFTLDTYADSPDSTNVSFIVEFV